MPFGNSTTARDGQWHINKENIVDIESKLYNGARIIVGTCKQDGEMGEFLTLRFMGIAAIS
jgi:hypothetical protein